VTKTFPLKKETQEAEFSVEILDYLMWFYYIGVSPCFKQAFEISAQQTTTLGGLDEANNNIKKLSVPQIPPQLKDSKLALRNRVVSEVRQVNWDKCNLFSQERTELVWGCVEFGAKVISEISEKNSTLFSYIPEYYLESVVDGFHSLRRLSTQDQFAMWTPSRKESVSSVLRIVVGVVSDPRIIIPDTKELLLQSVSVLLQYQTFVKWFETHESEATKLIMGIITGFDQQFWIPVTNIILRIFRGKGFCASLQVPPNKSIECASEILQHLFRKLTIEESKLMTDFLNRLLNQLSWSITEFGVCAKELSAIKKSTFSDTQQLLRRCFVVFELGNSLARLVEYLTLENPYFFLDNEMNLSRLSELIIFSLNRSTVGPDSHVFDQVIKAKYFPADKFNKTLVMAPLVGILLNLTHELKTPGKFSLEKFLVSGGLSLETIQYLCDHKWFSEVPTENEVELEKNRIKLKSLKIKLEEILVDEKKQKEEEGQSSSLKRTNSEDFCSICCSESIDTTFIPCNHRSCHKCIERRLLDSPNCFFCNAKIAKIVRDNDTENNNNAN